MCNHDGKMSMVRTQIQLTEEQAGALKAMAIDRGVSMAELIRQSVDQFLQAKSKPGREEMVKKLRETVGKYQTGSADMAERHDDYLDDVFASG
jgi:hypothetical protein